MKNKIINFSYQSLAYTIDFKQQLKGARYCKKGFLIKCTSSTACVAYADYSSEDLKSLKEELFLPKASLSFNFKRVQAQQSIKCLTQDLNCFKEQKNIFSKDFCINNHYLISDTYNFAFNQLNALWAKSYKSLKIKIPQDRKEIKRFFLELAKHSKQAFLLRLDFNAQFSKASLYLILDQISALLKDSCLKIEFLEDPLPYNTQDWLQLKDKYRHPLAIDLEWSAFVSQSSALSSSLSLSAPPLAFSVIVLKPAVQAVYSIVKDYHKANVKFVVTHYMDHSVGRIYALICLNQLLALYKKDLFLAAGLSGFIIKKDFINWDSYFKQDDSRLKIKNSICCLNDIFDSQALDWQDLNCEQV